jgi:N-dimethylarginine dimethylaminohydrolase
MGCTLRVEDEVSPLETVLLGTACNHVDLEGRDEAFLRRYRHDGASEIERAQALELEEMAQALQARGITVLRPAFVPDICQIFTRDLAFVAGDRLVLVRPAGGRSRELEGLRGLLDGLGPGSVLEVPEGVRLEGGDVIFRGHHVFVGQGERTDREGLRFMERLCPDKEVIPFDLVSSRDPREHVLHLDCAFQPLGREEAVIHLDGFRRRPDALLDLFGGGRLVEVDRQEFFDLACNILSLSPTTVVSERENRRFNAELRRRGFEVVEVGYRQVARSSGLFRCSTLPLARTKAAVQVLPSTRP